MSQFTDITIHALLDMPEVPLLQNSAGVDRLCLQRQDLYSNSTPLAGSPTCRTSSRDDNDQRRSDSCIARAAPKHSGMPSQAGARSEVNAVTASFWSSSVGSSGLSCPRFNSDTCNTTG